ncbi:zinc-ribbon domain-containing protein [Pseudoroseicyclus sp. H15]
MRLICPNCGAQYDVPDDVIPDEGRDVQCSACSHTWFERPGASVAEEEAPPPPVARPAPPPPDDPADDLPASLRRPPSPPRRVMPKPAPEPEAEDESEFAEPPPRPSVTPEIAAILREEAAREAEQRRVERQGGMETQTELGLDEASREDETRRRPARPLPGTAPAEGGPARRELLPDIDELQSSLRAEEEPAEAPDSPEDREAATRRGFRRGFSLTLLVLAVLALTYAFAPQIAGRVPALTPALSAYVDNIDAGRLWLDEEIEALTARINSVTGDTAAAE